MPIGAKQLALPWRWQEFTDKYVGYPSNPSDEQENVISTRAFSAFTTRPPHRFLPTLRYCGTLALLALVGLMGIAVAHAAGVPAGERQVLLELYDATGGASWEDNTGWLGAMGTECSWYGVTCNSAGDRVAEIELKDNNLSGELPDLSPLVALEALDIRKNSLTGSVPALPTSIVKFSAGGNQISTISDLSALVSLETLWISSNDLTGPLPALPPSIVSLTASYNQFIGNIPDLSGFSALESFDVTDNELTGSLPALPPSILRFRAGDNQLDGHIPDLSALTELVTYHVRDNQLTGAPASTPPASLKPNAIPGRVTGAIVCPNSLQLSGDPTIDSAWEAATGNTPWNKGCTVVDLIFSDRFEH